MKISHRPRLNITDEERYERKITQAREAKHRRKELRAVLSSTQTLCHERWCIRPAVEGTQVCSYHAGTTPKEVKEVKCLHCNGIAMPGSRLCGYHFENIAERRNETRKKNRESRLLKIREAMGERRAS